MRPPWHDTKIPFLPFSRPPSLLLPTLVPCTPSHRPVGCAPCSRATLYTYMRKRNVRVQVWYAVAAVALAYLSSFFAFVFSKNVTGWKRPWPRFRPFTFLPFKYCRFLSSPFERLCHTVFPFISYIRTCSAAHACSSSGTCEPDVNWPASVSSIPVFDTRQIHGGRQKNGWETLRRE